jgi:hypothetical protein
VNWTEVYKDAVVFQGVAYTQSPAQPGNVKTCRIIPCPGSYFPAHDETCEMVWDEEREEWSDCYCEERARARQV